MVILVRIDDGFACGGVIFHDDIIVRSAPIWRRDLLGQTFETFYLWAERHGAKWSWLEVSDPENWVC